MSRIFPSNGILPKIFTLQRQNCPPTFISRPHSSLLFLAWEDIYVSGGWFCVWRVILAHILLLMCPRLALSPSKDLEHTDN